MKHTIFTLLILFLSVFSANSQQKQILLNFESNNITFSKCTSDSTDVYYSLLFKNQQFKTLIDYQEILFKSQDDLTCFSSAMLLVLTNTTDSQDFDYLCQDGSVIIATFRIGRPAVYVGNSQGFCYLTEEQVQQLNKIIKQIKF